MTHYLRDIRILLALLLIAFLLFVVGVVLLKKAPLQENIHATTQPADELDIAVNEYLRSEGYNCQPGENWYTIAEARDFIPDEGFVFDDEGSRVSYEDYLIWLGYSCDGPMRGGGGNGPFIVLSRTVDGYKVVGELYGEAPLIEEAKPTDEQGVPNIVVIGDDAPPGNYDVMEWKWSSATGSYEERQLTEADKEALLDKYLKPAQMRSTIMFNGASALEALKEGDLAEFSEYVHPTKGIHECLRTWTPEQIKNLIGTDEVMRCGYGIGSGLPIDSTFRIEILNYMRTLNFLHAPRQEFDNRQANVAGSLVTFYSDDPDIHYVKYEFPWTGTYTGRDGKEWPNTSSFVTLVLQFEKGEGPNGWYITNIVSDYWTP